ncbi:MAG: glutamine--fructose-6-phosphate transaminase (isomerizing) [Elusimicrobiota bacterium]
MCGIVTYLGKQQALPLLLEGLKRLEYRGYDSAGIAVMDGQPVRLMKSVGKISELEARIDPVKFNGTAGIAHTRWATHGKPNEANAHPHFSCDRKLFLVHNGIIENYLPLRRELEAAGHKFVSETDTEVLVHLVEANKKSGLDLTAAVQHALRRVVGTFGIAVLDQDEPGVIVVAKRGSPLIIGIGNDEILAASDVSAFVRLTKQVVYLNDNDVATLRRGDYSIVSIEGPAEVEREVETVDISAEALEKRGFKHFMLKEIHQQPDTVVNAVRGRLLPEEGVSRLGGIEPVLERLKSARRLSIVSCGTSFYAGQYGRYVFEALTNLETDVALASEFRYRSVRFDEKSVVLALSQSGETADTLAAIREAKRKGALVLGIVNVVGSSIAREAGAGVFMHAGPEIGVASTKCFTSQSIIMVLMALLLGRYQNLTFNEGLRILRAIEEMPKHIQDMLDRQEQMLEIARKYHKAKNFLFIGRKYNYPIALEGALKLKEISYVHAEGYAAGEMKHGPIALIDESFPTMAVVPQDETYDKMISNIQEIKARNGKVIAVASEGDREIRKVVDDVFYIPRTLDLITPLLAVIPLQLFAYYTADLHGREIDKPRNLAKSVTVE